jgi:hypothetical protein
MDAMRLRVMQPTAVLAASTTSADPETFRTATPTVFSIVLNALT